MESKAIMNFILSKRIEADSAFITDLDLCQVRLINNVTFPWVILVPRQNDIKETIDLSAEDQQQLMVEIATMSKVMKAIYSPDKLNIAALGNMVPQLHVHVIARFKGDEAWPAPIWGKGGDHYDDKVMESTINKIKEALDNA